MFFYPPLEMLWQYNEGQKEVDETAKDWFRYKSLKVTSVADPQMQGRLLAFLPGFYLLLNLAFVLVICLSGKGLPTGASIRVSGRAF